MKHHVVALEKSKAEQQQLVAELLHLNVSQNGYMNGTSPDVVPDKIDLKFRKYLEDLKNFVDSGVTRKDNVCAVCQDLICKNKSLS